MPQKAVFLDRDGVLIENVSTYVRSVEEIQPFSYTTASLKKLVDAGFKLFVVTNQAIVGRGIMTLQAIEAIHSQVLAVVDPAGLIEESFICWHAPDSGCDCRKPLPGNLLRAAEKYNLDLSASYMIGDAVSDIEAGLAAGVTPVLVKTGRGVSQLEELAANHPGVRVASDFQDAAQVLLSLDRFKKED